MRLGFCMTFGVVCLSSPVASAQDGTRFVERAPLPKLPPEHTTERAGNAGAVAPWAIPGVTRFEAGGYVGGGSLRGNNVFARGRAATTGAPEVGTFGWDFVGFKLRPGRVFLAPSADPSGGASIARGYRAEGPHVPDVISLRPYRRAILEKKEATEARQGGADH